MGVTKQTCAVTLFSHPRSSTQVIPHLRSKNCAVGERKLDAESQIGPGSVRFPTAGVACGEKKSTLARRTCKHVHQNGRPVINQLELSLWSGSGCERVLPDSSCPNPITWCCASTNCWGHVWEKDVERNIRPNGYVILSLRVLQHWNWNTGMPNNEGSWINDHESSSLLDLSTAFCKYSCASLSSCSLSQIFKHELPQLPNRHCPKHP